MLRKGGGKIGKAGYFATKDELIGMGLTEIDIRDVILERLFGIGDRGLSLTEKALAQYRLGALQENDETTPRQPVRIDGPDPVLRTDPVGKVMSRLYSEGGTKREISHRDLERIAIPDDI